MKNQANTKVEHGTQVQFRMKDSKHSNNHTDNITTRTFWQSEVTAFFGPGMSHGERAHQHILPIIHAVDWHKLQPVTR